MKKTITLLLALVLLLLSATSLVGCDDGEGLREEIGLTYYIPEDWRELTLSGIQIAYTNGEAEFNVSATSYEDLAESTYDNMPDPWPTNVYDYVRQFVLYNGLPLSDYVYDEENDVAYIDFVFEYPADAGDMPDEYCLYVFMDNGEAIFVISYYCEAQYQHIYEPLFHEWREMLELKIVVPKD